MVTDAHPESDPVDDVDPDAHPDVLAVALDSWHAADPELDEPPELSALRAAVLDARAAGGAQLAAIDDAGAVREANDVTVQGTLSELRDLDYAEAITRFQLESTALQTAQTVFTRMQGLSLFNLLR